MIDIFKLIHVFPIMNPFDAILSLLHLRLQLVKFNGFPSWKEANILEMLLSSMHIITSILHTSVFHAVQ